jgi:hypothetical protein
MDTRGPSRQELLKGNLVSAEERIWIEDRVKRNEDAAEVQSVVLDEAYAH